MQKKLSTLLLVGLLILLTQALVAQETGEILGKVTDDESVGLPGVSITATSASLQGKRAVVSDPNGTFRLPLLPMGTYTLTFEMKGFSSLTLENVGVKLGLVTSPVAVMRPASVDAQLTVIAEAPLIDKTKSDTSFNVDSRELAKLPIQGRTINEVLSYTPGVTGVRHDTIKGTGSGGTDYGGGSIRGEGPNGNNWLVDGLSKRASVNNGFGTKINFDAWEEVQIISDGFSPELGATYGGIINIVTKTGSNQFHGELGTLIWDHNLRASRQPQIAIAVEPVTSQYNFFGNIGGPIIQDKLWFFLSDNLWRKADDSVASSVGWLDIPAGQRRVNSNNVLGKLTYALADNHTLSFSGSYDAFLSQSGGFGLPDLYTKVDYKDYALRLNYKGIIGANTLIEAAVGRSSQDSANAPLTDDYDSAPFSYSDINQAIGNVSSASGVIDQRTDFTTRFTQYLNTEKFGNHEIGLGAAYSYIYRNAYNHYTGRDWLIVPSDYWTGGSSITFTEPGVPYMLTQYRDQAYFNRGRSYSAYVKDKVTFGRLTLMLGLRSETQRIYDDQGALVPEISWGLDKFLSPRASLSWDVTGDGANVVKFGFGRFSDTMIWDIMGYFTQGGQTTFVKYVWNGPTPTYDTDTEALKDFANWTYRSQQGGTDTVRAYKRVREGTGPDFMNKFILEYDRRIGSHWAAKIRGVLSSHRAMLEDVALFDYTTAYYELINWDLKKRDYLGLELELNGRIGDKFILNSSYVWSSAKGSTPGNSEYVGNYGWSMYQTNGLFGDHYSGPADSPLAGNYNWSYGFGGIAYGDEGWYGYLPYSCDHVFKVFGTYLAPYGIMVSASAQLYSGYHWSIWGFQTGYGSYCYFPYGRGTETVPAHTYVDLTFAKNFKIASGMVAGLRLNVSNLLNSQRAVSYGSGEGSTFFRQVWGRQFPRWVQLQASLSF